MDKHTFLSNFAPKVELYELPGGDTIELQELTLEQRGKLHAAAKADPIEGQALIVCMGCKMFTEADIQDVKQLPGDLVTDIADAIIELSGLSEDAEKN